MLTDLSALVRFLDAQEAVLAARVHAEQLDNAAMFERLALRDLREYERAQRQCEAFLAVSDFCEQIEERVEQCTCPAARAVGLRSYWLWSKEEV